MFPTPAPKSRGASAPRKNNNSRRPRRMTSSNKATGNLRVNSGAGRPRTSLAPKETHSTHTASRTKLRIFPLGGLEEVGNNMMVYEYDDDIIIVDMGFAFPDDTTPGIDYIIPDTTYLENPEVKKKIRAVFITHGHMDHIGAIPYILPKIGDPPIYTLNLSASMIKKRLEEFSMDKRAKINVVKKDDVITVGNFTVRFFGVNHNIPDSMGLSINTPVGQIIHTGDWKIDHTPINEEPAEFHKIAGFGGEGVLALFSDSTNALKGGYCISESSLTEAMDRIFSDANGRIIFASFSSLIPRMQQVFNLAAKHNRKVLVTGRSMVNTIEIALSLGYLKIKPKIIMKSNELGKIPDNQVVIMTTGSQGEEASALARMSRGEHRTVKLKKNDTAIISASPIPGNERSIVSVIDNLTRQGVEVIYNKILDIHTSGHAQQEELKLMMQLTKPKYFVPIHGEHHMLMAHAKVAKSIAIPEDNIFVLENGTAVEFDENQKARRIENYAQAGYVFVDGLGVGDVGEVVIRDRQLMAEDGMFVVIVTLDKKTGKLTSHPDILSRGFVYMKSNDDLIREVKHEVRKLVEVQGKAKMEPNWAYLRQTLRDEVGEYLFNKTQRRPMVLPVIIEV